MIVEADGARATPDFRVPTAGAVLDRTGTAGIYCPIPPSNGAKIRNPKIIIRTTSNILKSSSAWKHVEDAYT